MHHKVIKIKCKLTNGGRRLEFIETKHATHMILVNHSMQVMSRTKIV